MTLLELKEFFESKMPHDQFNFKLSYPFSWRGSYDEIAFCVNESKSTAEENLEMIEKAYTDTFHGHKGGEYTFSDYTTVNFEEGSSNWTDGGYTEKIIETLQDNSYYDRETTMVMLAFKTT